jgi:hypothetical protein
MEGGPMSADLLARIDARLARLEQVLAVAPAASRPVMSTEEAADYLGLSERGMRAWAARWRVLPCGHGRWPLHRINAGLEREARQGERKARAITTCRTRRGQPSQAKPSGAVGAPAAQCSISACLA